ncbi:uncharacterized protein LOC135340180 [Halichondria panicea]|uniref:uncharacterized protein LOC135340180 n=1 Tax=Halichondria panicea TaxID=6063 RepID=UPI00312B8042
MDNSDDDLDSTVTISTDFYSPGDSRLLSLSSFFCDGGSLELSSNSVDAELFLIDDTSIPALNDTNQFTVSIESTIDSTEFRFWQYHLHPNSNISVSVCTDLLVDLYIVKGNNNANSWASNPSQDLAEMFQYAPACCNDLQNTSTISYRVEQEDEYYVILHNSLSMEIILSASLYFERTEYSVPDLSSKESCFVSEQGNCLVGIDYSTGSQQFLVITSIPERVDWGENVGVSLICDQRGWAYAVVILVTISVIITLVVAAVVLGIVCYYKCCILPPNQQTSNCLGVTSTLTLLQITLEMCTRLRVISTLTLRPTIQEVLTRLTQTSTRIIFLRTNLVCVMYMCMYIYIASQPG